MYVGAHDAVDVIDAGVTAVCNEPIEIEDNEVAMRLLEQPENWCVAPSAKALKGSA